MNEDFLLNSLDYNIRSIEEIYNKKDIIVKSNEDILKNITNLEHQIIDLKECKGYYSVAVNEIYEISIKALKDTLDTALQFIIFDRDLTTELVLEDKRGTKTLNIAIMDNETGYEVDIKDGTGMGIATVVSFVLKLYYLINKDSKILILDEKYSNVSVEYTPKFFEFMHKMADEKDFIILMVSHDERFVQYADRIYQVSKGFVTRLTR
jgi:DNA repair exonuclease SbcCD ATPase subunit